MNMKKTNEVIYLKHVYEDILYAETDIMKKKNNESSNNEFNPDYVESLYQNLNHNGTARNVVPYSAKNRKNHEKTIGKKNIPDLIATSARPVRKKQKTELHYAKLSLDVPSTSEPVRRDEIIYSEVTPN